MWLKQADIPVTLPILATKLYIPPRRPNAVRRPRLIDRLNNDLVRFLAYLVATLQTMAADLGSAVLGMLLSPQPSPTEAILTTLLNDLATLPDHFVLVLDD